MLTTYMQLEVTGSPKKGKNIGKKKGKHLKMHLQIACFV